MGSGSFQQPGVIRLGADTDGHFLVEHYFECTAFFQALMSEAASPTLALLKEAVAAAGAEAGSTTPSCRAFSLAFDASQLARPILFKISFVGGVITAPFQ